jgi:flagellar hook-associated protein 1 FlgK
MGFDGFRIALSGLQTSQAALQIVSHNLANADAPGYTRQRADIAAMTPLDTSGRTHLTTVGMVPQGVQVTSFDRIRAAFVDIQLREQMGKQGEFQLRQDTTQNIEDTFSDPSDHGIQTQMNQFWNSWQDVQTTPTSLAARQTLTQNASVLAGSIQDTRKQVTDLQNNLTNEYNNAITDINTIAGQIATLNTSIAEAVNTRQQPNDFYDARDLLLDKLSSYGDVTYSSDALQRVTVTMSGVNIVDPTVVPSGTNTLTLAQVKASLPSSGSLRAYDDLTVTKLPGYVAQLDTLASSMITAVNNQHALGFDLAGVAGGAFFSGTDASNIAVAAPVLGNPALVAAAAAPGAVGDGNNAQSISNLSQQNITAGTTPGDYYRTFVAQLGTDASDAKQKLATTDTLVTNLTSRRDSISGVNLDEEMTNMMQFQHAYAASGRVMQTWNDMYDTLINKMGF